MLKKYFRLLGAVASVEMLWLPASTVLAKPEMGLAVVLRPPSVSWKKKLSVSGGVVESPRKARSKLMTPHWTAVLLSIWTESRPPSEVARSWPEALAAMFPLLFQVPSPTAVAPVMGSPSLYAERSSDQTTAACEEAIMSGKMDENFKWFMVMFLVKI